MTAAYGDMSSETGMTRCLAALQFVTNTLKNRAFSITPTAAGRRMRFLPSALSLVSAMTPAPSPVSMRGKARASPTSGNRFDRAIALPSPATRKQIQLAVAAV